MLNLTTKTYERIASWFKKHDLDHAVIGFSGGIDSATTAALVSKAGIPVTLVLARAPNQVRESSYDPAEFCKLYENMDYRIIDFDFPKNLSNVAKEAALPIMRNACFYGIAAEHRALKHKSVVVGTANFDEAAYLGFWGKASDGAQDFYPISHLHKRQVYDIAYDLNVPQQIIDAIPSGDLLFSGYTNDYKMIGAEYIQIEAVAKAALGCNNIDKLIEFISTYVSMPEKFVDNILRNTHKYENPFPGFHLSTKLEHFRLRGYLMIKVAALHMEKNHVV